MDSEYITSPSCWASSRSQCRVSEKRLDHQCTPHAPPQVCFKSCSSLYAPECLFEKNMSVDLSADSMRHYNAALGKTHRQILQLSLLPVVLVQEFHSSSPHYSWKVSPHHLTNNCTLVIPMIHILEKINRDALPMHHPTKFNHLSVEILTPLLFHDGDRSQEEE